MLNKTAWARAAALSGAIAMMISVVPAELAFAQQSPSVALEQARKGEDGSTNAGAGSGSMESGKSGRDKDGNGGSANAGGSGETATADGSNGGGTGEKAAPLPENAELLDALGILDDVTTYGVDVLVGMDIPVELLPETVAETTAPTAPLDVNTGGQAGSGEAAGGGSAPAGGSTSTAAEDGSEKPARERKNKDGADDSASTTTNSNGGTDTSTSGS